MLLLLTRRRDYKQPSNIPLYHFLIIYFIHTDIQIDITSFFFSKTNHNENCISSCLQQDGENQGDIGHRIEMKDSNILCGQFSLPKPVFSVASWMRQVAYGSCYDKFETTTSLNMGIIGTIHYIYVFKRDDL